MKRTKLLLMALVIWAVARLATSVQAYDTKEIDIEYAKAGLVHEAKERVLDTQENIYEDGCQDFATFEIFEINETVDKTHIEVVYLMKIYSNNVFIVVPYNLDDEYFDEYYEDRDGWRIYDEITNKWYIGDNEIDMLDDIFYDRWPEIY